MLKNAKIFCLGSPWELTQTYLESALSERRFRPCGPLEVSTIGWCSPMGEDGTALVHEVAGCQLLCLRRQERLLPSEAVREALAERVAEIEDGEAREVGRAERRRIKDALIAEMLPRAFARSRRTLLYIDREAGCVVVDAASQSQAEDAVSLLRQTLGSLPAKPLAPANLPREILTDWLLYRATGAFRPEDACELRASDTGSVIRVSGQDLGSEEILNHLRAGKQVVKLALDWDERLRFVLADDLSLRRIKGADELLEDAAEAEDPAARLDAEFSIFALQLRELIGKLVELFGVEG